MKMHRMVAVLSLALGAAFTSLADPQEVLRRMDELGKEVFGTQDIKQLEPAGKDAVLQE